MVARRKPQRHLSSHHAVTGAGIQFTGDDVPGPSINPIDDASGGADLPAEHEQDSDRDQRAGDHNGDGDTQRYCPWCGGPLQLTEKGRVAANRVYERIQDRVAIPYW
jgi:hypothetical protein